MQPIHQQFNSAWTLMYKEVVLYAPKLLVSILIFVIFYLVSIGVKWLITRWLSHTKQRRPLLELFTKTAQVGIIILGLITALGTAGVNINALIASLGLFGFAAGYAFKDILSNLLAGVLILFYHPFKLGQTISSANFTGEVVEINLRYTVLKSDSQTILVPNATLLANVVAINHSNSSIPKSS